MTLKKGLAEAQEEILGILKKNLPPELTYHNYQHTLDVAEAADRIALGENIPEDDRQLLKTAAVFHDSGYIYLREKHEEKSCALAEEILRQKNVDEKSIRIVCELILATIYPPKPKNKLEEIICDADLDYLGRDDYFTIAINVYREFLHFGIVKNEEEWKIMQIRFLEAHKYYTETSNKLRAKKKEENLIEIKKSIRI